MKRLANMKQRQNGMSSVGWIIVAGIFGLLLISFFKVFPIYYDNFKLKTVLESLQHDTTVDSKSKRAIWESLRKRLYINEVRSIKREDIAMERKNGKTTVTVSYEQREKYLGNLFIGGQFVETVVIDR
jgi:hypothetical protein